MSEARRYRRILAAVDRTPRASHVVHAAAELAQTSGAELLLLRVLALPPEIVPAARTAVDPLPRELEAEAREELSALAKGRAGVKALAPEVTLAEPWRAITETAERVDADLIVVGSHGYKGWDRVLGTTAVKVVKHATRDVLVVSDRGAP